MDPGPFVGQISKDVGDEATNDVSNGAGDTVTPPQGRLVQALRWLMVLALAALAVAGVARAAAHRQRLAAAATSVPTVALPGAGVSAMAGAAASYTCAMHSAIVSAGPGTCPICNMNLTPARASANQGARPALVAVRAQEITRTIEAPAAIVPQERALASVTGRYNGWIEKLEVTETGRRVERGQVLAWIYSPDLIRAQKTFLSTRRWENNADPNSQPSQEPVANGDMFTEARFRVESFGVDPRDVDLIWKQGVQRTVPVRAPLGGVVIRKDAVVGGYVQPGAPLYTIADLATVSVLGDLLDADVGLVRAGQVATVLVRSLPGETFSGKVLFVAPVLDTPGGSAQVRIDLPNPGLRLRPGSLATLRLTLPPHPALAVPAAAVADAGAGPSVFVPAGDGFRRRPVAVGARSGDLIEILSGLAAGEQVVAHAAALAGAGDGVTP